MTTRRIPTRVKRALFVAGVLWALFHLVAIAVAVWARDVWPLAIVMLVDLAAGLTWLAYRIFPGDEGEGQ